MTLNKLLRTLFFIEKLCVCNCKYAAALILQSLKYKVFLFLLFICKIRLTTLHLIYFVITRMVLCWFINLSFCALLWKLHFLTLTYNYHQRQVIFLPWSILLRIYAIVFIMISGKQMEFFFFFVHMELIRNFWGVQGKGALTCSWIRVHAMAWSHVSKSPVQALSSIFSLASFCPILGRNMIIWHKVGHGRLHGFISIIREPTRLNTSRSASALWFK